jgi:ketosteroid isomerase-like protein
MDKALDVVNRFYDTTDNKKGEGLEVLLAKDMKFVGPLMRSSSAKEYVELTKQLLQMHVETRMLRQFEQGNDVCSIYDLTLRTPSGGTITLPIADLIRVSDGKIAEQTIYYDPRDFAKAFGM